MMALTDWRERREQVLGTMRTLPWTVVVAMATVEIARSQESSVELLSRDSGQSERVRRPAISTVAMATEEKFL